MSQVQAAANVPRIQYIANGNQTSFPVPFPVVDSNDLVVFVDARLVTTGYGYAPSNGLSFAEAPASGQRITILRSMTISRAAEFQEGGDLRAAALNAEFVRLMLLLQQVDEKTSRSIVSPPERAPADLTLPLPGPGYLRWSADGSALELDTSVSHSVEAVLSAKALVETARDQAESEATRAANEAGRARAAADAAASAAQQAANGLLLGVNVQAWDADLDRIAALAGAGIPLRDANGNWSQLTAGSGADQLLQLPSDGKLPAIEAANLRFGGAAQRGDILFFNGTSWSRLAADAAGKLLKSSGPGADPVWTNPPLVQSDIANLNAGVI